MQESPPKPRKPKSPGGFTRPVANPRNSITSGAWEDLDWGNWWMDAWETDAWRYLHVANKDGDRVHRVYPREKKGRRVTLRVKDGVLCWVYDPTAEEQEAWHRQWKAYEASR
jgi:hypothetical protein